MPNFAEDPGSTDKNVSGSYNSRMKSAHICIFGLFCLLPLAASAQWQWVDKDGRKVFSDQPPPLSIPEKNIVRRSAAPPARLISSDNVPTPAASAASGAAPAKPLTAASGVDNELQQKARKTEDAEKAVRAAEQLRVTQAKADNCVRARQGKATFDSGVRLARMNAQGEREIMDDNARSSELARLQSMIDSDCI